MKSLPLPYIFLWRFSLVTLKGLPGHESKKLPDFWMSIYSGNRGAELSVSCH
jgi:hypothetical protein